MRVNATRMPQRAACCDATSSNRTFKCTSLWEAQCHTMHTDTPLGFFCATLEGVRVNYGCIGF